jgi:hypothetical protein
MASAPSLTFIDRIGPDTQRATEDADFINFLMTEAENAKDESLDEQRAAAIDAYFGNPYGDEVEGRSQAVTRDVAEVVDQMHTGLMGVILAGAKAVEFETEEEQVPQLGPDGKPMVGEDGQPVMTEINYGAEITAAVQYQFFRKQPGYRIIHDTAKAGLLEKTAQVKTYARPKAPARRQVEVPAETLVEDESGIRLANGTPVLDYAPGAPAEPDPLAELTGEPQPLYATYLVTVEEEVEPDIVDVAVPNEFFRVSPDTVELDEAAYIGDCTPKSISELVAMGYDRELLETIWSANEDDTVVARARDSERSSTRQTMSQRTGPQRQLWLYEEYPLYDLNGDGIAERLFVHRIGRNVLNVMEADEQPYSGWSPLPMPHRYVGQSLADKTQDIQRVRSVLQRQALDSLYLSNAPRMLVSQDAMTEDTIDDLLTVIPGALVRYKGSVPPLPLAMQDTSATAFNAMEMMSSERESRTGVTRQSQGLNPDTMNKTASGMAMLQANAAQLELSVIRNFAEGVVAPMFAKRYRLMKRYPKPFRMKIAGGYRTVDPARWPDEIDVTINVGIGTGTKEQRIGYQQTLAAFQAQIAQSESRLVDDEVIFNLVSDMAEDMGIGVATRYFKDPAKLPPAPEPGEQPDPALVKVQGDQQLAQAELQARQQKDMAGIELQARKDQMEAQLRAQSAEFDLQARREAAELDSQLKRDRAIDEARRADERQQFDMMMARERFAFDMEMAQRRADAQAAAAETNEGGLPAFRPGGDLDK